MGYHVHQMIDLVLEGVKSNFAEMFLHHTVTLLLYGFSYLTNMTDSGSLIMFLHDLADIFTSFSRCIVELRGAPFAYFSF